MSRWNTFALLLLVFVLTLFAWAGINGVAVVWHLLDSRS